MSFHILQLRNFELFVTLSRKLTFFCARGEKLTLSPFENKNIESIFAIELGVIYEFLN